MAITFVSAGTFNHANVIGTSGLLADVPSSISDGDLLVLFCFRSQNGRSAAWDTLSGWTLETAISSEDTTGRDRCNAVYTRIASSEPANYLPTSGSVETAPTSTQMVAYRGVDETTPLDVAPVAAHWDWDQNKASPNVDPFMEITTVTDGAFVLAWEGVTHDDITSAADPSGYTNRVRQIGSAIDHRQQQLWDLEKSSAGAETPGTPAYTSNNTVAESILLVMALRPAGGGGGLDIPLAMHHYKQMRGTG